MKLLILIVQSPERIFEYCLMDFIGARTPTAEGNRYILTIQFLFSIYCILVLVKNANAREVATAMIQKFICYFSPPDAVLTDQGRHFINKLLDEFVIIFKIDKFCTTKYCPQSNESIEHMHQPLHKYLRMFQDDSTAFGAAFL